MPFLPASSSEIWLTALMGSSTSTRSTTVSVWKTSTTCLSSLYVASMARSWPKCFLAAWVIAFCSVSTRTERSMPLSLATWSRTMFKLTIGACGAGEAILLLSFLDVEYCFYVCLAALPIRDVDHLAAHVDHHFAPAKPFQASDER